MCLAIAGKLYLNEPGVLRSGNFDNLVGSSLALDVLIIILPIPVLLKLKLNSKQKVSRINLLYRLHPDGRFSLAGPRWDVCYRILRDRHPNHPNLYHKKPPVIYRQCRHHHLVSD